MKRIPSVPQNVIAGLASSSSAMVHWDAVEGADRYIIRRFGYEGSEIGSQNPVTVEAPITSATVGILSVGTTLIRVYAENDEGLSGFGFTIITTVAAPVIPFRINLQSASSNSFTFSYGLLDQVSQTDFAHICNIMTLESWTVPVRIVNGTRFADFNDLPIGEYFAMAHAQGRRQFMSDSHIRFSSTF